MLPLLLFVMAIVIEFGFLFQSYEVVTNAAREGARMGALPDYLPGSGVTALTDPVKDHVRDYLSKGAPGASLNTICAITGGYDTSAGIGQIVTVNLSCTMPSRVLSSFARLVGGTAVSEVTLQTTSVMRVEYAGGS